MHRLWVRSWIVLMVIGGCVAGLIAPAVAQEEDVEDISELPGYVAGFSQLSWNPGALAGEDVLGPEFMYAIVVEFEDAGAAGRGLEVMSLTDDQSTTVEPREELGDDSVAMVTEDDEAGTTAYSLAVREDDVLFYVAVAGDDTAEDVLYDVMDMMLSREPSDDPAVVDGDAQVTGSWAAVFPTEDDADILMGLEPYPVFDLRALVENQAATPAA